MQHAMVKSALNTREMLKIFLQITQARLMSLLFLFKKSKVVLNSYERCVKKGFASQYGLPVYNKIMTHEKEKNVSVICLILLQSKTVQPGCNR